MEMLRVLETGQSGTTFIREKKRKGNFCFIDALISLSCSSRAAHHHLPPHLPSPPSLQNQCCGLLNGPADWGKNFDVPLGANKICQCEEQKPSADLCTYFQGRLIYKMVRKTRMFHSSSPKRGFKLWLVLGTGIVISPLSCQKGKVLSLCQSEVPLCHLL